MKFRNLIILLVTCCGLAAAAYVVLAPTEQSDRRSMLGQKPFESLAVNDIAAITINTPDSEIVLRKKASHWVVANKFNYPADFAKIADFLKKIKRLTIGRTFKASPDAITRLSLHQPDRSDVANSQKGVRVLLTDQNKTTLLDLIIGKTRTSSAGTGGQYVLPSTTPTVYLVDRDFRYIDREPSGWMDLSLLDIKADDIETVVAYPPGRKQPLYTLQRPAKDKAPVIINTPKNKTVSASKIEQVFEALLGLEINNVAAPDIDDKSTGFETSPHVEYHLFDGTVYRITPGSAVDADDKLFYLKVDVRYSEPKHPPSDDRLSPQAEETARIPEENELKSPIDRWNRRLSHWTYIVSSWKIERFVTDPDQLYDN